VKHQFNLKIVEIEQLDYLDNFTLHL
jgi:hypothetical protein